MHVVIAAFYHLHKGHTSSGLNDLLRTAYDRFALTHLQVAQSSHEGGVRSRKAPV